jgi:hypothetical protein
MHACRLSGRKITERKNNLEKGEGDKTKAHRFLQQLFERRAGDQVFEPGPREILRRQVFCIKKS